ncbi:MAG: Asp-tRNA(Asn)/Glu-tRNA(Gln) amidotransferase subunit GatA [Actinobacteria bacterium]|nr:MAG: Asp-tRNA(Asn)/Glu-tRNA(Gln) amidotransferase subunit GatA [Actinomycetota bacterium]
MDLSELGIGRLYRMRVMDQCRSVDVADAVLKRVEAVEPKVGAYLYLADAERVRAAARAADEKLARTGYLEALEGMPVAVKDNMCTKGLPTTCASKILEGHVPPYDATVVSRLLEKNAGIVGKANMDEFAFGSSTESSHYKNTANPWDLARVPGGSSGGSAAAVAADECIYALGSDTGGSIRQPASFCGVVGMKPTYGRVSRYGLVAFASSLDQIGPITKNVLDCAIVLEQISGKDRMDSTSVDREVPRYASELNPEVTDLKIGVIRELAGKGIQKEINFAIDNAGLLFEQLGASLDYVSLPHLEYALPAYYIIGPAEASSNLARFDGVRYGYRTADADDMLEMYMKTRAEGFGAESKRRIMLGTYALSAGYYEAYYGQAQKIRTLIIQDFEKAFEQFDVLISPTSPTTAFGIGEKTGDPLQMYLSDICTIPVNLAGIPAISIPCGIAMGLPIGLQIIGRHFDEQRVLNVAAAFEKAFGWDLKPSLREGGEAGE